MAEPVVIQSVLGVQGGGIPFLFPNTSGNTIVVYYAYTGGTGPSISDTQGNSYTAYAQVSEGTIPDSSSLPALRREQTPSASQRWAAAECTASSNTLASRASRHPTRQRAQSPERRCRSVRSRPPQPTRRLSCSPQAAETDPSRTPAAGQHGTTSRRSMSPKRCSSLPQETVRTTPQP